MNLANHPRFAKLKPSKLVLTINNLLADLLICQTFFHQMYKTSQFVKLSPHQTFPLYGIRHNVVFHYEAFSKVFESGKTNFQHVCNYMYIPKYHTNDSYIQLQLAIVVYGVHIKIMFVHHNPQI